MTDKIRHWDHKTRVYDKERDYVPLATVVVSQKNKRYDKNAAMFLVGDEWINIIELAKRAGTTTLKAQKYMRWGKTPEQVIAMGENEYSESC